MRELDCDFCGATAAGTYEIGPAPPERSPSDRQRLVLCADCRATLADAIQPLLDRLAAAEDRGVDEGDVSTDPGRTAGGHDDTAGRQGRSTDPLDGGGTTAETERTVSEGAADGTDVTSETALAGETGELDTGDADDETAVTGSVDTETDTRGAATDAEDNGTGRTDNATATSESANTDESTDTDESAGTGKSSETAPPSEEPPEFRKVVRLLNNRSFPVARAEFVELAASAYDLEESTVTESLAYAVDRGVLAVEDGEISRG